VTPILKFTRTLAIDDKAKVSAGLPASAEQLRNLSAALSSEYPVSIGVH
jgi:hypothetical protein